MCFYDFMKINKVQIQNTNFNGITNISASSQAISTLYTQGYYHKTVPVLQINRLILELFDGEKLKDAAVFKALANVRREFGDFQPAHNSRNGILIDILEEKPLLSAEDAEDRRIADNLRAQFLLNGTEIEANDANLKVFKYIGEIFKRVQEQKKFFFDENSMYKNIISGAHFGNKPIDDDIFRLIHSGRETQAVAKNMTADLIERMQYYMEV